eukprot:219140-Pelagomonas_calceolata.AAC.2
MDCAHFPATQGGSHTRSHTHLGAPPKPPWSGSKRFASCAVQVVSACSAASGPMEPAPSPLGSADRALDSWLITEVPWGSTRQRLFQTQALYVWHTIVMHPCIAMDSPGAQFSPSLWTFCQCDNFSATETAVHVVGCKHSL